MRRNDRNIDGENTLESSFSSETKCETWAPRLHSNHSRSSSCRDLCMISLSAISIHLFNCFQSFLSLIIIVIGTTISFVNRLGETIMTNSSEVEQLLNEAFSPMKLMVTDQSDGCGKVFMAKHLMFPCLTFAISPSCLQGPSLR